MKKKGITMLMAAALMVTLAGCGNSNNGGNTETNNAGTAGNATTTTENATTDNKPAEPEKKEDVTIKVFQFKVEIADALQKLAEAYEAETGVKVEIETHGGGEDYSALLKAELAAGEEPEIFNSSGWAGFDPYVDRATDLSGESWAKDLVEASKAQISRDGKLLGMPMNLEAYGFTYNKDLFAKAGITALPQTIDELEAAVKKLQDAGITPFALTSEWWSMGIHTMNISLANHDDPAAFIEDVKAGKATFKDDPIMKDWLRLVDIMFANGQKNALTTDYNTQVAEFAAGKYAIIQHGNWIQGMVDEVNPEMNLGMMPVPLKAQPYAFTGVPNNWIVNNKSAHPEEAKKFLEWMVTSETGQKFIATDFKFIPAVSTITPDTAAIGKIGGDFATFSQEHPEQVKGWNWDRFPDGITQQWGSAMQEYLGKQITGDQLLEKFDKAVADIVKR
ncbi:raffinose/stachyose/melibiose transport system substrate-binding protein [Paenibacillus phyllosphaerae]|uniref:Raffinose/stachyose/melibiose transport system substrate-binding protein n=1 Tax=Paenibacillus phyllosphaerae TaxID=274593 RepID=A0A7W5FN36_9BACL|nr:ABC transporter substrate-binding protein [Paenibacillus phyllosphaerae]MBB3110727.1 raffinose/stachyose/melibiose transport system substrate-binding protein [Paenibacillus phyllosphaerae]